LNPKNAPHEQMLELLLRRCFT